MSEITFDNVKITSSFDVPETGGNLVSGETIGKHFGKIAKHMEDGSIHHTVDNVLSDTSENPVQNKVIKIELDNKADKTVATTSTDGLMSAADKKKLDGLSVGTGEVDNIDGIPVDLTGIYNTQMIGYDEEQGKLVPMSAVAKTQTVIPSTETPRIWELTESDPQGRLEENYPTYPRYICPSTGTNDLKTAIITFKYPFMLSEFNTINATVHRDGSYYSYKIIFSKNPDFSTIDAEYIISNSNNGTLNIANLYGKYYMRFVYMSTYNGISSLWIDSFTMS